MWGLTESVVRSTFTKETTEALLFKHTHTPAWRIRNLAEARVRRGVSWLNHNAPLGWQRHMFTVRTWKGQLTVEPRFRTCSFARDVISIAFESKREFADLDGQVNSRTLQKHFGKGLDLSDFGFDADIKAKISTELLDELWVEAITSYAQPCSDTRPGVLEYREVA